MYRADFRHASAADGAQFYLTNNNQNLTSVLTTNNTGGWFNFITTSMSGLVLNAGLQEIKIHFDSNSEVNISSIDFVKVGEISQANFSSVSAKTGSVEKSIELYLNQNLDENSIANSKDEFTITVDGESVSINSLSYNDEKSRTLIVNLVDNLLFDQEILISYSGESVLSKTNKPLQKFTNLSVLNNLEARYVLPAKIQAEDYVNMLGISVESTSDTGGGSNIGYTHKDDYAEYKIYNDERRKFTVDFRIASNSDAGEISLDLVEESTGRFITIMDKLTLPVTNDWQSWTTITKNLSEDVRKGVHIIRLNIHKGGFNMNWMDFKEIDTDGDGVSDSNDNCPDTPQGTRVDVNGCPVFELPLNNFKVEVGSATCVGKSDGVINLSVEDASYDYSVTITGQSDLSITGTSTTASFTGLAKGTYEVCFKVVGQDGYEQCFEVVVGEPKPLSAFIDVDDDSGKISISMSGSDSYNININGIDTTVDGDLFDTELSTGLSIIRISTDLECQGVIEREVFISEKIHYYPNPTISNVNVHVGGEDASVKVSVFSEKGDLIYTRDQNVEQGSRKIHIDLTNQITGTYIVTLESKTVRQSFKVIRE